jgi:hypothetical protein
VALLIPLFAVLPAAASQLLPKTAPKNTENTSNTCGSSPCSSSRRGERDGKVERVCALSSGPINSKRALWALSSWPGSHSLSLSLYTVSAPKTEYHRAQETKREKGTGTGRDFGFGGIASGSQLLLHIHTRHARSIAQQPSQ